MQSDHGREGWRVCGMRNALFGSPDRCNPIYLAAHPHSSNLRLASARLLSFLCLLDRSALLPVRFMQPLYSATLSSFVSHRFARL